jgi:hypothetical protein
LGAEDPKVLNNLLPPSPDRFSQNPGTFDGARLISSRRQKKSWGRARLTDETGPEDCLAANYFAALTFRVRVAFLPFAGDP